MHLRPRLVGAFLVAGVVAAIVPVGPAFALVVASGLLGAMVLADVLMAPHASELRPRRKVATVLRMDRPADVVVDVHNPTGRQLAIGLHDATPPSMRREPLRHHVT